MQQKRQNEHPVLPQFLTEKSKKDIRRRLGFDLIEQARKQQKPLK